MATENELALVIGVDAAGKSTFLHGLRDTLNYTVLEPTGSREAQEFRIAHRTDQLTPALVRVRHQLFGTLNALLDQKTEEKLRDNSVATSGSRLVTNVSHMTMQRLIGGDAVPNDVVVEQWQRGVSIKPSRIVFLHAPIETIEERLEARQRAGIKNELLHGFNSLSFLEHYQEALADTFEHLSPYYSTLSIDSSITSPEANIEAYEAL